VIAARSIMQQSVFNDRRVTSDDPMLVLQKTEGQMRLVAMMALGLGVVALVTSLIALWVSLAQ